MEDVKNADSGEKFVAVPKRKAAKRKSNQTDSTSVPSNDIEMTNTEAELTRPEYPPAKRDKIENGTEMRKISVPAHRYSPLKENWMKIFSPIVEHLHLQIRFNLKVRQVEIRSCKDTKDIGETQYSPFHNSFVYFSF